MAGTDVGSGPAKGKSWRTAVQLGLTSVVVASLAAVLLWRHPRDTTTTELVAVALAGTVLATLVALWSRHGRRAGVGQGGELDDAARAPAPVELRPAASLPADHFADFVSHVHFGVLMLRHQSGDDPESIVITSANSAMQRYLTVPPPDTVGLRLVDVFPGLQAPPGQALLEGLRTLHEQAETVWVQIETELWPGLGIQHLALGAVPLTAQSIAVVVDDVTARVNAERALAERASSDALTGLVNRGELLDRLRRRLEQRDAGDVTLLIADLDRFKDVNDTFGHERGDQFLKKVSERLQLVAPTGATVARIGGDEFALLLAPGATTQDGVLAAEAIEEALLEPVSVTPWLQLHVGTSIGIASAPLHARDADTLVVRADVAMYEAKRTCIGHQVYEPSLDRSSVRRMVLLGDLRRAIANGELVLHYQPVVDPDGSIVALEGLVRWRHPDLGTVLPGEFIELVELGSLSQPLAFTVVRQAVAHAITCREMGNDIGVSINLTPRNLTDAGLLDGLERVVGEAKLPPGTLTVELTERHLLADSPETHEALGRLHRAGLRVAIDDFGTGSTSLYVLRSLNVDELKIDRVFVDDLRQGHDAVVRSIVDLAHDLGLTVVAEGVEDLATQRRLVELGVDRMQGFAIGRPVPADTSTRLVAAGARSN
ncbi:MAG: EAL domain-containing protein [Ilumatobacteraceae bacterium]|nr:MAG: EAL domain-containing protein [Actinomycetota bacterium]